MSLQTLKRLVRKMIDEEDSAHPMTDDHIAKKLAEAGHPSDPPHRGQVPRRPPYSQPPINAGSRLRNPLKRPVRVRRPAIGDPYRLEWFRQEHRPQDI